MQSFDPIEQLWDALLSRDNKLIQAAYDSLNSDEQNAVLLHLKRMAEEPDWHPEQRLSARLALQCITAH